MCSNVSREILRPDDAKPVPSVISANITSTTTTSTTSTAKVQETQEPSNCTKDDTTVPTSPCTPPAATSTMTVSLGEPFQEQPTMRSIKQRDMVIERANRVVWASRFYAKKINFKLLFNEFVAFRSSVIQSTTIMDKHVTKCRYRDIGCIDATRVILQGRSPDNDFIHANWMTMPDGYRYISSQAPMDNTVDDFWHMCVTENVGFIIMVCNFAEGSMRKCAQYIPLENNECRTFGTYRVRRTSKITFFTEGVKQQELEVIDKTSQEVKLTLMHLHYTEWTDHMAPQSPAICLKILKLVRGDSNTRPTLIHCSAGVGRTSTFIGIDYGSQRIGQSPEVKMLDVVRELRSMRERSVQTHYQYVFMIVCITELFVEEGGVIRNENMTGLLDFYRKRVQKSKHAVTTSQQDAAEKPSHGPSLGPGRTAKKKVSKVLSKASRKNSTKK